jgi:PRTRC genetic system protein A
MHPLQRINLGGVFLSPYGGGDLPPFAPGVFHFDYVLARNGLFVRGKRDGMEVVLPVSNVRGALFTLTPAFRWDYPPVPARIVTAILKAAREARNASGHLVETLCYLRHQSTEEGWTLQIPEQIATRASVTPGPAAQEGFGEVLIELHSHAALPAFFSATDNGSEGLLRLYAVLGWVERQPTLRLRVGVYSYWLEIPAGVVFALEGSGVEAARLEQCDA